MDELDRRIMLQKYLSTLPEVKKAYFQPGTSVQMVYPCIVYKWDRESVVYADNEPYLLRRGYLVTIIDSNPDSTIPITFRKNFPTARFDRSYTEDNMNHWVYTLFF